MYTCLNGINTNICKIVSLFFADDGMMLMQTIHEVKESIQILANIANNCGLCIHKNKSNIKIFHSKNQLEYIEDIPITTSITYLEVYIHNKKILLQTTEKRSNKKSKHLQNIIPVIIDKSCNILIVIGKTYWRSAALPAILHETETIYLSNTYLTNIQKEENKAFRYIVNGRRKTTISDLEVNLIYHYN